MKTTTRKPAPLPIVWVAATIKVIDVATNRWKTIGACPWTPRHVQEFLHKHKLRSAWVFAAGDREYVIAAK